MSEEEVQVIENGATEVAIELVHSSPKVVVSGETEINSSTSSDPLLNQNNTSDEQIDTLLKEVEEIRNNKESSTPIKVKSQDSMQSTPNSTILSTQQEDASITLDSPPKELEKPVLKEVSVEETTKKANLPNSISQALFSQPLKVTKIREKSPTPKFVGIKKPEDPASSKRFELLQKSDLELTQKILKLNKEIEYLKSLVETANVTSDLSELRKLKYAIERLEEYLDKKQKEKYEIGIQLTRAVRRRVDSGESGEFWVN